MTRADGYMNAVNSLPAGAGREMWRSPKSTAEFAWAVFAGGPGAAVHRDQPDAAGTAADSSSEAYAIADAMNHLYADLLRVGAPAWGEIVAVRHWSATPERVAYCMLGRDGVLDRRLPVDAPGLRPWRCDVTLPHEPHPCGVGFLDAGTTHHCAGVPAS